MSKVTSKINLTLKEIKNKLDSLNILGIDINFDGHRIIINKPNGKDNTKIIIDEECENEFYVIVNYNSNTSPDTFDKDLDSHDIDEVVTFTKNCLNCVG